jgi:hypothetical protein
MPWTFRESLEEFTERMDCPSYRGKDGNTYFQNGAISIGGVDHQPPPFDDEPLLERRWQFAKHFLSLVRREAAKLQAAGSGAIDDHSYPLPVTYTWDEDILGRQPMPGTHPHLFDQSTGCDPLFDEVLKQIVFPIVEKWKAEFSRLQSLYESLPAVAARLDAERRSQAEVDHLNSVRLGRMQAVRQLSIP